MSFKDWHIQESISISPQIKEFKFIVSSNAAAQYGDLNKLKQFVKVAFSKYLGTDFSNFMHRYDVFLKEINYHYKAEFEFEIKPSGIKIPEKADPNNDSYEYYQTHKGGVTGKHLHKTPKDAIQEIPKNENLVYRGMSWEEWQFIRKNGFIQSKGSYNLGSIQNNLTFYGSAATAEHYANSFAPMQFMTSLRKPSVVIAVSKKNVKTHKDLPDAIPGSEFAHIGKLSSSEIVAAWMLSPVSSRIGKLSLAFDYTIVKKDDIGNYTRELSPDPKEGSRSSPSIGYALRKLI